MGLSLYYSAQRDQRLSSAEWLVVDAAIARFNEYADRYWQDEMGFNWESFYVYDPVEPSEPGVVFEGATKLPDISDDALQVGLQHWCQLLAEIRLNVPGAIWQVDLDDLEITWNEDRGVYDLPE